jgi:hypothetical protein
VITKCGSETPVERTPGLRDCEIMASVKAGEPVPPDLAAQRRLACA